MLSFNKVFISIFSKFFEQANNKFNLSLFIKANNPILFSVSMILFAILFNLGYYLWRAYILGRKKTIPIIYTVCYVCLNIVSVVVITYSVMETAFQMMNTMM